MAQDARDHTLWPTRLGWSSGCYAQWETPLGWPGGPDPAGSPHYVSHVGVKQAFPVGDTISVVAGFHPGQPSVSQRQYSSPAHGHDRPSRDDSRAEQLRRLHHRWAGRAGATATTSAVSCEQSHSPLRTMSRVVAGFHPASPRCLSHHTVTPRTGTIAPAEIHPMPNSCAASNDHTQLGSGADVCSE